MLYLFDLDGTVIRSFLREGAPRTPENYAEVELLPGRREKLDELRDGGHDIAFVTNQGGVAFGYQTVPEVMEKMTRVREALGIERGGPFVCTGPHPDPPMPYLFYIAHGHPKAAIDHWRVDDGWRKPGGDMIIQAMIDHLAPIQSVLMVGDMDTDRGAAEAAGVRYRDVGEFFA